MKIYEMEPDMDPGVGPGVDENGRWGRGDRNNPGGPVIKRYEEYSHKENGSWK
ncbi:MAG: hypothetical protein ACYDHW_14230 [Syntrophorhabdaceae bacterium]